MRYAWFVAVPVLVAALWTLVLWTPQTSPDLPAADEPLPPADAPAPAPEPRVLEAPAALVPSPAPEPGVTDPPAPAQPPELPRLPPPTVQGPVATLKSRYQNESALGSPPPQQLQLTAAFNADVADLLDNVECRRTVCRVRVSWQPKHGFSGMRLLAELRRDFDPNLAIDQAGPSGPNGAQSLDIYIDLTSSRPQVP